MLLIAPFFSGCDSYIPSPKKLRHFSNPSKAFIIGERNIRGVYGNLDFDSAIYAYETDAANENEFWTLLDQQATDFGWRHVETLDAETLESYRRFVRIFPKKGQERWHSVEEVRVAYRPDSNEVFIAWVQADPLELPDDPDDGVEDNFAKEVVWPRFDEERLLRGLLQ